MPPIDRSLLEKYIRGECDPLEESEVHRWLDDNDVTAYPDVHRQKKYERKIQAGWLQMVEDFNVLGVHSPNKRYWNRRWLLAAASVILVALTFYLYRILSPGFSYDAKYETSYGEIKRINLADGTTVTLNALSTLEVAKNYNTDNRDVYLQGEAYFQVKDKAEKPFVVHAKRLSATALGTSFDVSAFSDDPAISVSLKEGKVLVRAHTGGKVKDVVLEPGEGVIYKKDSALLQMGEFNPKVQLAWQQQIISFENADMQEVVRKLERFYGVRISTKGLSPRHWQLTGEYKNQTLKDILESLSFNYDLRYKVNGKEIILYNP